MAHKGKFHKLWFRRDFVNLHNYRNGYGEAYYLTGLGITSSSYDFGRLFNVLAINTQIEGVENQRKWFSADIPPGEKGISWKFEVDDTNYEEPRSFIFSIFSNLDPVLVIIRFRNTGSDFYQQFISGRQFEVLVKHSSVSFPFGDPFVRFNVAAYDRYNP